MFENRADAAMQLIEHLVKYKSKNPLVLGIPRGGVVVAAILARGLGGELDIILTRKLRTPGNPELAMGSIDESGEVYLNNSLIQMLRIPREMIEEERIRQLSVLRARAEAYRRIQPRLSPEGRTVIVTDDGIATGATMKAAIHMVRQAAPKRLTVALPVGPPDQVAELQSAADEVICILTPADFMAVGQFYESFAQIEDEDVERILSDFARPRI